jgi:hypothetical protein
MKRHADNSKGSTPAVGEILTKTKVAGRKILRFGRVEKTPRNVHPLEPCVCGLWTVCKCG